MAGFIGKVSAFARSPQGRKLIQQAQAAAKDPATRAKVQAQAQALSQKLKDPETRAKVQQQAQGLTQRLKEATGSSGKPGQGGSGQSQGPTRNQNPQNTQGDDAPVYGTPPTSEAPRYGQPPQQH